MKSLMLAVLSTIFVNGIAHAEEAKPIQAARNCSLEDIRGRMCYFDMDPRTTGTTFVPTAQGYPFIIDVDQGCGGLNITTPDGRYITLRDGAGYEFKVGGTYTLFTTNEWRGCQIGVFGEQ